MKKMLLAVFMSTCMVGIVAAGDSAKDTIAEAKAEMKKAKEVGFLWRDTGKYIEKAEKALAKGEEEKAQKLASHAKLEGTQAQAQAKSQANAGPLF